MKQWLLKWFERAMTEPHVNSRIVFLIQGLSTSLSVLVLVVAFLITKNKESYPVMTSVVLGGGVGAAAGRLLTKWKSVNAADPVDSPTQGDK